MTVYCDRCPAEISSPSDGKMTTRLAPEVESARLCQDCYDEVDIVDFGDWLAQR